MPLMISKSSGLLSFAAAPLAGIVSGATLSSIESSAKSMRPISGSAGSRSNPSPPSRMIPSPDSTLTSISRDSISSSTAFTSAIAPVTDSAAISSAISRLIQVFFMPTTSL